MGAPEQQRCAAGRLQCIESWSCSVCTVVAGWLPNPEASVAAIGGMAWAYVLGWPALCPTSITAHSHIMHSMPCRKKTFLGRQLRAVAALQRCSNCGGCSTWPLQPSRWRPLQGQWTASEGEGSCRDCSQGCGCSYYEPANCCLARACTRFKRWGKQFTAGPSTVAPCVCAHSPPSLLNTLICRVGNALGAGKAALARLSALSATAAAPLLWLAIAAVLLIPATQRMLIGLFTSGADEQLVAHMRGLIYIVVVLEFFDGAQTVMSGVVSGAGKQAWGFLFNAVAYWLIALPLALLLGFWAGLGVEGIYTGMVGGPLTQCACYAVLLWGLRWEDEAAAAARRVQEACGGG